MPNECVKIEYTGNELKYIKRLIEFLESMINDIVKGSVSVPASDHEIAIFCFVISTSLQLSILGRKVKMKPPKN